MPPPTTKTVTAIHDCEAEMFRVRETLNRGSDDVRADQKQPETEEQICDQNSRRGDGNFLPAMDSLHFSSTSKNLRSCSYTFVAHLPVPYPCHVLDQLFRLLVYEFRFSQSFSEICCEIEEGRGWRRGPGEE